MKEILKNNKGFSLIEILIVMAIMVIIGTVVIMYFLQAVGVNQQVSKNVAAQNVCEAVLDDIQANVANCVAGYIVNISGTSELEDYISNAKTASIYNAKNVTMKYYACINDKIITGEYTAGTPVSETVIASSKGLNISNLDLTFEMDNKYMLIMKMNADFQNKKIVSDEKSVSLFNIHAQTAANNVGPSGSGEIEKIAAVDGTIPDKGNCFIYFLY